MATNAHCAARIRLGGGLFDTRKVIGFWSCVVAGVGELTGHVLQQCRLRECWSRTVDGAMLDDPEDPHGVTARNPVASVLRVIVDRTVHALQKQYGPVVGRVVKNDAAGIEQVAHMWQMAHGIESFAASVGRAPIGRFATASGSSIPSPESLAVVATRLADAGLMVQDQRSLMSVLRNDFGASAKRIVDIIASGVLQDSGGLKELLSSLRSTHTRAAAITQMEFGMNLHRLGHEQLVFERKLDGPGAYDIDVGILTADRQRIKFAYQLKECNVEGLQGATKKAVRQLRNAPADGRAAIVDVRNTPDLFPPAMLVGLTQRAVDSGVALHLRFEGGESVTFPWRAKLLPS